MGVLIVLLLQMNRADAAAINVLDIVGKDQESVARIIGEPASCKQTYQGVSCRYPDNNLEVVFINDRADWMLLDNLNRLKFHYNALSAIGLRPVPPLINNPFRMHWQHHHGLEVISIYGSGEYVAFIQIKAFTA